MSLHKQKHLNEYYYIPTLYFVEGLPYAIVTMVSTIWFKDINISLTEIGIATTILYLPWTLKFIWAPIVDFYDTKKKWILKQQLILTILFLLLATTSLFFNSYIAFSVILLIIALASATQDIAIDGYYLEVLSSKQQAYFVGFRNTAYKIAWIFATGFLVFMAGNFEKYFSKNVSWAITLIIVSLSIMTAYLFHTMTLPNIIAKPKTKEKFTFYTLKKFIYVFLNYFNQSKIIAITLFILLYRLGESLLLKMASPFLLDLKINGGLNIPLTSLGLIYGTYGMLALLFGGILGGYLISKLGLKKLLFPFALFQNLLILSYYYLSTVKPGINIITILNALEQFAYGLGTSAYTIFLLQTVNPKFKSSHYAIATALMAFGVFIPQLFSGYLATGLGYSNYFILCAILSIPGLITIFFLPIKEINNGLS